MDKTTEPSDAVRWTDGGPSAPLVIPITFFVVSAVAILCLILKYIMCLYDKKRKSDTYVFVDMTDEEANHDGTLKKSKNISILHNSDPKLSSLIYKSDGKKNSSNTSLDEVDDMTKLHDDFNGNTPSAPSIERLSLQVEASVHDSSIGAINTHEHLLNGVEGIDTSEEGGSNTATLPMKNKKNKKKKRVQTTATESDV